MLKNGNNINILLKDDNKGIGYLLAIPHNDAVVTELEHDDQLMQKDVLDIILKLWLFCQNIAGKRVFL